MSIRCLAETTFTVLQDCLAMLPGVSCQLFTSPFQSINFSKDMEPGSIIFTEGFSLQDSMSVLEVRPLRIIVRVRS